MNPYVTSRVNGIKIPLLPHQGGILHRFGNQENQLVIKDAHEGGTPAAGEEAPLVVPGAVDPALVQAKAENEELRARLAALEDLMAKQAAPAAELAEAPAPVVTEAPAPVVTEAPAPVAADAAPARTPAKRGRPASKPQEASPAPTMPGADNAPPVL